MILSNHPRLSRGGALSDMFSYLMEEEEYASTLHHQKEKERAAITFRMNNNSEIAANLGHSNLLLRHHQIIMRGDSLLQLRVMAVKHE